MYEYIAEKLNVLVGPTTFNGVLDDVQWPSQQSILAAASYYYAAHNQKKFNENIKELWRNKIIANGNPNNAEGLLGKYLVSASIKDLFKNNFETPSINMRILPQYSFFLQFHFTLEKPYVSRDDKAFYICENPVRKDKVFGLPLVEGSAWKGNMRWTAGKIIEMNIPCAEKIKRRLQLVKLFGHENPAEERYFDEFVTGDEEYKNQLKRWTRLRKGRLHFYPTFFDRIGIEVINPHDRMTKAGKNPITIETVPPGTEGVFSLLYLPFDLICFPAEAKTEFCSDIEFIMYLIKEMMRTYGFSAKKSSGFGIAKDNIKGCLTIKDFPKPFAFKKKKFDDLCKYSANLTQEVAVHVK